MTHHNLTLTDDATVTERFLLTVLDRILGEDDEAYNAWITDAYQLCTDDLTDREFALFDLTDAVSEHFGVTTPGMNKESWADYISDLFATAA